MRILAVDHSLVGQSELAKRVQSFDPSEQESLDISLQLANAENCLERLRDIDVVILGSGLAEHAPNLARQIRDQSDAVILLFVTDDAYSGPIFRQAHAAKVRKVMPERASNLDLLQELVSIQEEFCSQGRMRRGRVIAVTHAKGGVGATTFTAALAEALCVRRSRTTVWDLDIEGLDLTRALAVSTGNDRHLTEWIMGIKEPSRVDLADSLNTISPYGTILTPPTDLAAAMDLIGHPDMVSLSLRLLSLLRFSSENVIVDTGGRLSASTAAIMKAADIVLMVIDDSLLGLTAIEPFCAALRSIAGENKVYLIGSGTKLSTRALVSESRFEECLGPASLSLPSIPFDPAAARWPGQRKTLYSMGGRRTRARINAIVDQLDLISNRTVVPIGRGRKQRAQVAERETGAQVRSAGSFFSRLAMKGS